MRPPVLYATSLLASSAFVFPAFSQATSPNLLDSFRLGSGGGAICQAQNKSSDPAFSNIFDRGWTIACRDAPKPVGQIYALRSSAAGAAERAAKTSADLQSCSAGQAVAIEGLPGASVATCADGQLVYRFERGRISYLAKGLASYKDALTLGLRTIVANRLVPGKIEVASTSGDDQAFARAQAEALDPQTRLAEGYRRNNSGNYVEAAQFFDAVQLQALEATAGDKQETAAEKQLRRHEYLINRALQQSNLGDFEQANALLDEAARIPASDRVQVRLRRNFDAMHLLNQQKLDDALAALSRSFTPIEQVISTEANGVIMGEQVAAEINGGIPTNASLGVKQNNKLTPDERASIIDAQALQLRGTILRLQGKPTEGRAEMARALADAIKVRDGRVTSIARLRAQIMAEIALTHEQDGDFSAARSWLDGALALLKTTYPETSAVNAARARLAAFLTRRGNKAEALDLYRKVIASTTANSSGLTGLANQITPYFDLLAADLAQQPALAEDMFIATQTLIRPGAADTMEVLSRELEAGDDQAARLFRQSVTLGRDIERSRIELARLVQLASQDGSAAPLVTAQQADIENLIKQQTETLNALSAFPQFRAISKSTLTLADLRSALKDGEAYFKLAQSGSNVYAIYVDGQTATGYKLAVSARGLAQKVQTLRDSISVWENGRPTTYAFDVALARALYLDLFDPVASRLKNVKHLVFEPDGAMLKMPVNLLIADQGGVDAYSARVAKSADNEFDFRGIQWLGRDMAVSTSVSARSFRDARQAPNSAGRKQYLGFGNNAPAFSQLVSRSGSRPGQFDSMDCSWPLEEWNKPISAAELKDAAKLIGADESQVITGRVFTDSSVMTKPDLAEYRILHFATHGFVSAPRVGCPARPALLTSFGGTGSDGLLSFSEIFDLRIDADVVILSACDTAGEASAAATREAGVTTGGGGALDGLVRAFIGAGGRSVIASHWPAPDDFDATRKLISGLFSDGNSSVADAMRKAQLKLMDEADTSHPYYWSGFAIVGDGQRPLLSASR